ncbi:MAG TPA: hypothetical protein VG755_16505, partial [Nannocystaceae bacterium]|nr:hypothetical protein [Nannocystaceae bacterium]
MKTSRFIAVLALLGGCAGGEMSRFGDADGVFSTGESSGGGDESPTTDPTATDDGAEGDPTTAPATDDGADASTTDPTAADSAADDDSSSDDGSVEESSSSGSAEVTTDPSTSSESSDGGDTAMPVDVDLSGWTIVQTDSAREIELPAGTIVPLG